MNFDRDIAPDPRNAVTESMFAKFSFASGNGVKMERGVRTEPETSG